MSERNVENGVESPIEQVTFSELGVGDQIILSTGSGSVYHLTVVEQTDVGKTKADVARESDHHVKGDPRTWEQANETSSPFELRGSCMHALQNEEVLYPVDLSYGKFIVGELAWMGTQVDGQDHTIVTSSIEQIEVIKAATDA